MASAAQYTFIQALQAAEGVRQTAKAAAFTTYQTAGFTPAARTTYIAAALAADVAYQLAVKNAQNTEAELLGNIGYAGLYPSNIANVTGM